MGALTELIRQTVLFCEGIERSVPGANAHLLREDALQATRELAQIREALGLVGLWPKTVRDAEEIEAALALLPDVAPGMTDLMVPPESIVVTEDTTPTVSVPVGGLREIEWANNDAVLKGRDGCACYIRIHRCPACHRVKRIDNPDEYKKANISHLFGHSEDCWLAAALRDAGKEEPCPRS